MRLLSTTERRVVAAILVTALIPLVLASFFAQKLIARISATAFQPEFGQEIDRSLSVYADLAKAIKTGMRAEGDAVANSHEMFVLASAGDRAAIDRHLRREFVAHPMLASLAVATCSGEVVAKVDRDHPIDPKTERELTLHRPVGPSSEEAGACAEDGKPLELISVFATPRAHFDELEGAEQFSRAYHQMERDHRTEYLDETYVPVFEVLLGVTVALAVLVGLFVARPVTRRIGRLAAAMRPVAEGDLTVRVNLEGNDEIAELGRAFDTMLEELDRSRARVEFLKRMSEFQKMARRLAHEIKNPLTPIQLAVEECHRRSDTADPEYKRVVDTMALVVKEEVGSLRRLVSEFSSFARLPRADLAEQDLAGFLEEQKEHFLAARGSFLDEDEGDLLGHVDLSFEIEKTPMIAAMDREMLHRVLQNVIRNAAQAMRDAHPVNLRAGSWGTIIVRVNARGDGFVIDVDDSGPGIAEGVRSTIFDPYVTTRNDGTGLGLSIVKKIVVDHGGTIEALSNPNGGARFSIFIPRAGTSESKVAVERSLTEQSEE